MNLNQEITKREGEIAALQAELDVLRKAHRLCTGREPKTSEAPIAVPRKKRVKQKKRAVVAATTTRPLAVVILSYARRVQAAGLRLTFRDVSWPNRSSAYSKCSKLVMTGHLMRVDDGVYEITQKGRDYLAKREAETAKTTTTSGA